MWKLLLLVLFSAFGFIWAKNGKALLVNEVMDERREMERLITDILLNTQSAYKCVAILCDDVYYNIFREAFFQKMSLYISYFIILFQANDDLLMPYPDTQAALQMIKKQYCQMYIILISNGIQTSRLLRYGDRYRVLDTRVNFVMLYDNRLFTKDLHYLWKRIVNVIFIREYAGIKKVAGERRIIPWFELSTVPFPSPIKGVFLPRRLDIWRQNKFRTEANLFRDKTFDLKNQTVRVATFQHIPASTKVPIPEFKTAKSVLDAGTYGFTGIEIEILSTVAQNMNFFPEIYEPENADQEYWGNKQPDGQYSGMFGELIQSRADIGLGDFYYTPQILDIMDLTLPYSTECLTFLTPEALTDNSWKTLILPFKPLMWGGVLLAIFICAVLLYYLAQFHYKMFCELQIAEQFIVIEKKVKPLSIPFEAVKKLDSDAKYVLMKQQIDTSQKPEVMPEGLNLFLDGFNSVLYTYSMILMVSLPKLPEGWSLRILIGCYWLYCTLVVVTYRASMTAILANPAPRVTIDTLQELVDSKLSVGSWGEINREFFMTSLDPLGQEIGAKFTITNDTDLAVDRIAMGKFALYDNTQYLKQVSVKRQLRIEMAKANSTPIPPGDRNLHVMSDCVINMPISIGMQKNSPIKPRVDKFIRRVIEAGLIKKWLDDVMQSTLNAETVTGEGTKALMSTNKFIGAIVVLFAGYFISLSTFVAEMVYFHRIVKRHPNFDKYSRTIQHEKKL